MKKLALIGLIFFYGNLFAQSGLVVYYPFNGNANDESGNGINGTVKGAILTTDRFGNANSAYSFDGVNDEIEAPHNSLLNITQQITLAAWIFPTTKKTQEIIHKGPEVYVPYALSLSATGDIIFTLMPNSQFTQVRKTGYTLNVWTFVAGTYNGTTMKLYVNGNLEKSVSISGVLNQNSSPLQIGTRLNLASDTFKGRLDDIRIFNRALTDGEIRTLFQESPTSKPPPTNLTVLSGYNSAIPIAWNPPSGANRQRSANMGSFDIIKGSLLINSADTRKLFINKNSKSIIPDMMSSTGLLGYNVYRSSSAGGPYLKIAHNISKQYYRDESTANGRTYYYVVTAVYDAGESNYSNESFGQSQVNGYYITSGWASTSPTLDGVINTNEWSNAATANITYPGYSGTVTFYVMNNSNQLFIAVDDKRDHVLNNWDNFSIIFDKNRDRKWPQSSPSNEGLIRLHWDTGSNSAKNVFQGIYGQWPSNIHGDPEQKDAGVNQTVSLSSGNVQYEGSINLNTSNLNASPGDIIGLLIFTYNTGHGDFDGLWPQEIKSIRDNIDPTLYRSVWNWSHAPFSYGDLKLATSLPMISGYVRTSTGAPISGVTLNGLPGSPITNANGYYSVTVSYGWYGTVTPDKSGCTFSPTSRSYSYVTNDRSNQNYTGTCGQPPNRPTNLRVIYRSDRNELTWTDNSDNEAGFKIYKNSVFYDSVGVNDTTYTDTNPSPPNNMTVKEEFNHCCQQDKPVYKVTAFNIWGESDSNPDIPQPPLNCIATPLSPNSINLTWDDNSTIEDGFQIWRTEYPDATYPDDYIFINTIISAVPGNKGSKSYTDVGLVPGKTYYYLIFAFKGNGGTACTEAYTTTPMHTPSPISPIVSNSQITAGSEFWVDIQVGSSSQPVTNLKIVTFELLYTNTSIIDYVSYEVGSFLTGAQANVFHDDTNGKISASVYRMSGGNSGYGVVLRIKFKILNSAHTGQIVNFSFGEVQANNSTGESIALIPTTTNITISGGVAVWPGDANNDCKVDIFDINYVVSIYWNKTGSARPNASNQWIAQMCQPWNPVEATYADCDGNGTVYIFDINSVIVNYGNEHPLLVGLKIPDESDLRESLNKLHGIKSSFLNPPISIEERDYDYNTKEFWMDIIVGSPTHPISDLKIVTFELTYSNTANIDYVSYEIGPFISAAQATVMPDDPNGKISASVYRISGGDSGSGVVLCLKFKAEKGHTVNFDFGTVMANSSDGSTIPLTPEGRTIIISIEKFSVAKPVDFTLLQNYPNPFNLRTTIQYSLPRYLHVQVDIISLNGQVIRNVVNEHKPAGTYEIVWDSRMNNGKLAASGIYLYRIKTSEYESIKKLILLK